MRRLRDNRKFQIFAVVLLLLIVAVVSADRFSSVNILRNIVTAPVTLVQSVINGVSTEVDSFFTTIKEYDSLKQENLKLKKELIELKEKTATIHELEYENNRLRKALMLKDMYEGYEIIGSNILGANPGNFSYNFRIDIGEIEGIKPDDPVLITENVLYGRIFSTSLNSSIIIPIIDEQSGISAWIPKEDGGHVVVRGDIKLKEQGFCRIEKISKDISIKPGDVVETSGLGGIYPKGIIIGTVDEVFNNQSGERYATLKPLVDLNTAKEVFVLKEKNRGK